MEGDIPHPSLSLLSPFEMGICMERRRRDIIVGASPFLHENGNIDEPS